MQAKPCAILLKTQHALWHAYMARPAAKHQKAYAKGVQLHPSQE